MPCSIAYLIREPEIYEVAEERVYVWGSEGGWDYYQPLLVPEYKIGLTYDYGYCCGIDGHTEKFATRAGAQEFIDDLKAGKNTWLKYDPEVIADHAAKDEG
jgi:hypothetical protein